MKTWMRPMTLGVFLIAGTVGCDVLGPDSNGIDVEAIRAEAALVAADGMFQDLSLTQDPGLQELGFNGMAAGPALVGGPGGSGPGNSGPGGNGQGGSCQRLGTGPSFGCGQMVRDGFTFTREVTFFDADLNEQPDGFDPISTDAIHLVVTGEGTRERAFWSASIARSRDMWMTGLLSDTHILNGIANGTVYRSGNPGDGVARSFFMTVDAEWIDVVHLQPLAEHPYPMSGTVTRDIFVEVTKDGEVVGGRDVSTVITFNGTQFVTMTVDGEEVEIDLAERGVNRRFHRGGGQG